MKHMTKELPVIGSNTKVDFVGHVVDVPAKVDTGADSSSVWVSRIHITPTGVLEFVLFDKGSPFYTGEVIRRTAYRVAHVKNSTGHAEVRYRTQLSVRIGGRRIRAFFNLSDRRKNQFPVLIGRRTLAGKFLVDVTEFEVKPVSSRVSPRLNRELSKNPYHFYQKYHSNKK